MEETLEVGGLLVLVGNELLEHRTWAKFFATICESLRAAATILDNQDDLSSAS
jgi:hypothetical protein